MITVKFQDVGRKKLSWTETMDALTQRNLRHAVKKRHALMSQYPDFEVGEDGTGMIFAGIYPVGRFTVEEAKEAQ